MYKISRQHIMTTLSLLLFCSVPILASCCGKKNKCFNSVIACSIAAGYLRVVGNSQFDTNINVGGTISVIGNVSGSGTITVTGNITSIDGNISAPTGIISDENGSIGDLLAYGGWFNSDAQVVGGSSNIFQFPTVTTVTPADIIPSGPNNEVFTVTRAGQYLVLYNVLCTSVDGPFTTIALQRQPAAGGGFARVQGSTVVMTAVLDTAIVEASSAILVSAGAGDQFRLAVPTGALQTVVSDGGTGASITFVYIHS